MLLDGGCDRVLVVVGAAGDEVAALLADPGWARSRVEVEVVRSEDWASGMSASLAAGLRAVTSDAALVHLVDLPDVGPDVLRRVLERGCRFRNSLARAAYAGRPGHPVLVGADHVAPLLATLTGDEGARAYLEAHDVLVVECGELATGRDDDEPDEISTPDDARPPG